MRCWGCPFIIIFNPLHLTSTKLALYITAHQLKKDEPKTKKGEHIAESREETALRKKRDFLLRETMDIGHFSRTPLNRFVDPAFRVDKSAHARVRRPDEGSSIFNRSKNRCLQMHKRRFGVLEPGVIGHIDQYIGPLLDKMAG